MKTRKVVLYGSSLVMSTIAASLREKRDFHVSQIRELLPENIDLGTSPPDAVLFDLAVGQLPFAISLLNRHPRLFA